MPTRRGVLGRWLSSLAMASFDINYRNITELAGAAVHPRLCDLGCDDGEWTMKVARAARSTEVVGVEILPERVLLARQRGIQAVIADLNRPLPFEDCSFDLVHANQVIEHVGSIDVFLSEVHRVLRPGGVSIISTENASSWHNIGAAVLGWQIFSLTNVSPRVSGVGNPLALHRDEPIPVGSSWTHKTIFNFRGLLEVHRVYGLDPVRVMGAGYHPLPAHVGRLDARHAHFLTVLAVKAEGTEALVLHPALAAEASAFATLDS